MGATNLPRLKYVEIDSIDSSDYIINFSVSEELDVAFKTCTLVLKRSVNTLFTFNEKEIIGKSIIVKRGVTTAEEDILFRGNIISVNFQGSRVMINCQDKLSSTRDLIINESFDWTTDPEAGIISELVKTIISENTNLTYSGSSVQDSGTVNIRKKLVCRHRTVWSALKELAFSLDWQIYYNPNDDLVYFEPRGFRSGTTILNTSTNIVKLPRWNINSKKLFNKITVIGSPQEVLKVAGPYLLDGSQSGWGISEVVLPEKPIAVKVLSDTSNPPTTQKVAGVEGSSETYDYEVNKELQKVVWHTDDFTPTTSYYAQVEYTYNLPVNITRKNQSSIDLYTDGTAKAVTQNREDIKTNDDAADWASKQLEIYSEPFYSTVLYVRSVTDLVVGYLYTIQDNIEGIDKSLMVTKIKYNYPYKYDEIKVSDKEYRERNLADSPAERIKRLEEKQTDDSEKHTIYNDFTRQSRQEKRETQVKSRGITGDFMIWGHPTSRGVWGSPNKWGTNSNTYSVKKLTPGNNIFKELGYDTDYFDSSSTASQDLVSKEIDFTSGQIYQTELISLGTTHTHYTIALASVTGTVQVEISGDGGSTYETVSLGIRTAFTSADANGVLVKITETGFTTATLANTYKASGAYDEPILKVMLEN